MGDEQKDWCFICSIAGAALACGGEERLRQKVKIYQPLYVMTLAYGQETWIMTTRRSQTQVAETSFLQRVAELCFKERGRNSVIWVEIKEGGLRFSASKVVS